VMTIIPIITMAALRHVLSSQDLHVMAFLLFARNALMGLQKALSNVMTTIRRMETAALVPA